LWKDSGLRKYLKSKKQYLIMQIRQTIAIICFCAVLCVLIQPVTAIIVNGNETDDGTYYYNLGSRLIASGDFERAVNAFDNALASNTTMIEKSGVIVYVYSDKAGALIDLGKYNDAIAVSEKGLAIDNTYRGLWSNKGYALYKLGKYQEAINAYDKAISIDSSIPKYWINKGDALYEMGRYQEAVDSYSHALTIDPGNTDATAGLAKAQKAAASTIPPMISIVLIIMIIAAGGVIYYIKFRKPAEETQGDKRIKEKKK
jgi:tetratricopeptide (TPR) repeat protein